MKPVLAYINRVGCLDPFTSNSVLSTLDHFPFVPIPLLHSIYPSILRPIGYCASVTQLVFLTCVCLCFPIAELMAEKRPVK